MSISKNYYDDVGILYSYTADFGSGYCVKRWNVDFDPGKDKPSFDGVPSALWQYLDKDFKRDIEAFKKKREIRLSHGTGYPITMKGVKRELVIDSTVLAKFALLENELSHKTQAFIQGEIDLEKTVEVLQSLL